MLLLQFAEGMQVYFFADDPESLVEAVSSLQDISITLMKSMKELLTESKG